jgi:hypothetical protein
MRRRGSAHGDDAADEDARRHDRLRVERTDLHHLVHLRNGAGRGGGHDRPEVAPGLAVDEVAQPIAAVGLDQREICRERVLEHVRPPADDARLLALCEQRAVAGGREERADAGPRGADPLDEIALRDHFQLDLARAVERVEHVGVRLPRERADDLAHPPGLEQRGEAGVTVPRVVVDHRQVFRALRDERFDQIGGLPGGAEPADHDGGAVVNAGDGGFQRGDGLVHHVSPAAGSRVESARRRSPRPTWPACTRASPRTPSRGRSRSCQCRRRARRGSRACSS